MSKHTPGPWRAQGNLIFSTDRTHVCKLFTLPRNVGESVAHIEAANADLIAAAPAMLEALKKSYSDLQRYAPNSTGSSFARVAIAIAEGRTE